MNMAKRTVVLALLGLAHALSSSSTDGSSYADDQLTISTTSGHIHGKIDATLPNVRQFLGVPFAHPPTGQLRFSPPRALSQPNARIEATQLPPSCPQFLSTLGNTVYTRDVLQFNLQGLNTTGAISEDCLTASVWAPTLSKSPSGYGENTQEALPVLIYIYGGGYATGGQDVPYQIPAQWVQRSQRHLVVSFNYRVNIFGFPAAKGLKHQNVALLDQRRAVEWCKENIAAFGGDPNKMVLWGQSAGAGSVDFYNYAYPDDPIVTGLIMDSGTALIPIGGDASGKTFTYVAENVGCAGLATKPAAQLSCMRKVPWEKLEDFIANQANTGASPSLAFGPIPDGESVFANYTKRALAGKQAKIPAIIGTDLQDGIPFAPYNPAGPNQTFAHVALLTVFLCPATETIRLRQQTGRLTYSYRYVGNFSNVSPQPWMGAYHGAELPLIMGVHPDYRGPSTKLEYATSHAMQDAWVAFARDPVRGLADQKWSAYTRLGSKQVREFGAGVAAKDVSLASVEGQCDGAGVKTPS